MIEVSRIARIDTIDLCFEREKRFMIDHYQKKAKKNKVAKKFFT